MITRNIAFSPREAAVGRRANPKGKKPLAEKPAKGIASLIRKADALKARADRFHAKKNFRKAGELYDEATRLYRAVAKSDRKAVFEVREIYADALFRLATIRHSEGHKKLGGNLFRKALELDPSLPEKYGWVKAACSGILGGMGT